MTFDFDSEVPIYLQVAEEIQDAILCGAFPEDTQVPSTTEISVTYKINPATVLKGMTLLTEEGVLYKKRGVGMFVSPGAAGQIRQKRRPAILRDVYCQAYQRSGEAGHQPRGDSADDSQRTEGRD